MLRFFAAWLKNTRRNKYGGSLSQAFEHEHHRELAGFCRVPFANFISKGAEIHFYAFVGAGRDKACLPVFFENAVKEINFSLKRTVFAGS